MLPRKTGYCEDDDRVLVVESQFVDVVWSTRRLGRVEHDPSLVPGQLLRCPVNRGKSLRGSSYSSGPDLWNRRNVRNVLSTLYNLKKIRQICPSIF